MVIVVRRTIKKNQFGAAKETVAPPPGLKTNLKPSWASVPEKRYHIEVLKNWANCDVTLEHPSLSR